MSGHNREQEREAARWLKIAEDDRDVERICLEAVSPKIEIAAYHCQQSVEKLIKGMLVCVGVHFPKTHDIRALTELAEVHFPNCRELFSRGVPLTGWGFVYRYPGLEDELPPDAEDILEAMATIDQLAAHLRTLVTRGAPPPK
jgi:HEPN domain-containing protein